MALQNIIQTAKRGFDKDLQVCDSQQTITTTDGELQVSSADAIINVGDGLFAAVLWMDISAIDVASNDEVIDIIVQGSTSATFASGVVSLAVKKLGAKEVVGADVDVDASAGIYQLYFDNEFANTIYPYLRVHMATSGNTPSITFDNAFFAPL